MAEEAMEGKPEELVLRDPSPGHWLTRWLILRSLGVLYVVAFAILLAHQPGLLGPRGILPVGRYLALLQEKWDAGPVRGVGEDEAQMSSMKS